MSPRRRPADRARARSVGLAALVAALVLGILGMHALGAGAHAATPDASGLTGLTGMSAMDVMTGMADPVATTDQDHGPPHASGHAPLPHHGGMVMLCALMLAGAAVWLLLLLVRRRVRGPLLPPALQPAPALLRAARWARDTGPPAVWEFSVVRC
jgi:hypothetical protein